MLVVVERVRSQREKVYLGARCPVDMDDPLAAAR